MYLHSTLIWGQKEPVYTYVYWQFNCIDIFVPLCVRLQKLNFCIFVNPPSYLHLYSHTKVTPIVNPSSLIQYKRHTE